VREAWGGLRLAASFLTRLPVGEGVACDPDRLARSLSLFPAVGLLLGLLLALTDVALRAVFPVPVVAGLLLLLLVAVTGGLHLDGLADTVDGLAGGRDREGALRIMKDSRVGALGAAALVLDLLLHWLCLWSLPAAVRAAGLVLMPAAGRWAQVALACTCRYARPGGGTGAAFVELAGRRELVLASLTLGAAAVALWGWRGAALLPPLAVALLLLRRLFLRRLGGVTGDLLGAATEVGQIVVLMALLALSRQPV
jgi:adenosylcobinamide-GDP ribazoletransferase